MRYFQRCAKLYGFEYSMYYNFLLRFSEACQCLRRLPERLHLHMPQQDDGDRHTRTPTAHSDVNGRHAKWDRRASRVPPCFASNTAERCPNVSCCVLCPTKRVVRTPLTSAETDLVSLIATEHTHKRAEARFGYSQANAEFVTNGLISSCKISGRGSRFQD